MSNNIFSETTVWKETVKLAEKSQNLLFDLKKLNVCVVGAGSIMKKWRKKENIKQKELAEKLGLKSRMSLTDFERDKIAVPIRILFEIAKLLNKNKELRILLKNTSFSCGRQECKLPLKPEEIKGIIKFLKPINDRVVKISLKASEKDLKKIKEIFALKINKRPSVRTINSKSLVEFLNTFYEYTKKCKLKLPLTKFIANIKDKKIDLRKSIILPMLLSDGNGNEKYFAVNNKSRIFHDVFVDAVFYQYHIFPSGYFFDSDKDGTYETYYIVPKKISKELLNLCGSFKTSPAKKQNPRIFLKETQPTMKYLLNASKREKEIAFRLYASAEGYIGHTGKNPKLEIACAHPKLANDLHQITQEIGIKMQIVTGKNTWSKIVGLGTGSVREIEKFKKIGGFLDAITIEGKSKYLRGIQKNKVLEIVLKHNKEIAENKKEEPSKQVLNFINKTISSQITL